MTERLARACACHPWRTLAAWGVVIVASFAALALLLTSLTTEGKGTNNPQSERASDRLGAAFPPDPRIAASDVIIVRSARYTVGEPRFRDFVARLYREGKASGGVFGGRTYYTTGDRGLVSRDRHATLVPVEVGDAKFADKLIPVVDRADANPDYQVAVTGNATRDHDFNTLSERDLRNGELKFGLPAALIILLLVF